MGLNKRGGGAGGRMGLGAFDELVKVSPERLVLGEVLKYSSNIMIFPGTILSQTLSNTVFGEE